MTVGETAFSYFHGNFHLHIYNKRAQRALGRSPEERVKGDGGANNREPQGHNLNNFGRGPFMYILNMKALGLVVSDKKIFESFILKPIY